VTWALLALSVTDALAAKDDCPKQFEKPYAIFVGDNLQLDGTLNINAAGGNLLVGKQINSHDGAVTTSSDIYVGTSQKGLDSYINVHVVGCKQQPKVTVAAPRDITKATWVFRADGTAETPFGVFSQVVTTPSGGTWTWVQADGSDQDFPLGSWFWKSDLSVTPLSGQVAVLSSLQLNSPIFIQGSLQVFGTLQARSDLKVFSPIDLGLYVKNVLRIKGGSVNVQGYSWTKRLHVSPGTNGCSFEGGLWVDQNANIGAYCRIDSSSVTLAEALKHIDTPAGMKVAAISNFSGPGTDVSGFGYAVFLTGTSVRSMDDILDAMATAAETNAPPSSEILDLVSTAQTFRLGTTLDQGVDMGELMSLPTNLYAHFFVQRMLREQLGAIAPVLSNRMSFPNGSNAGEFIETSGLNAGTSLGWYALDITTELVATDAATIELFVNMYRSRLTDATEAQLAEAAYARKTEWASTLGIAVSPPAQAAFSAMSIIDCSADSTEVKLIYSPGGASQHNRNYPSAYCIDVPYTRGCSPTAAAGSLAYYGCRNTSNAACLPAQTTIANHMADKMQTGDPRYFPCNLYAWIIPWAANNTCPLAISPGFVAGAASYGLDFSAKETSYGTPLQASFYFSKIVDEIDFSRVPLVDLGFDPAWGDHTIAAFGYKIYHTPAACYDRHYFYAFTTNRSMEYHRIDWYSTGETFWGFHSFWEPERACTTPGGGGGGGGGCASALDAGSATVLVLGLGIMRLLAKRRKQ
jgi:hypothetical protein